jgi:hypothetical protein
MKNFDEGVRFNGITQFNILPEEFVGTFGAADTTPSVKNVRVWKCGGSVVTITDFDDSADCHILFLRGDGATTITHGTNIKTNTGANKLLAANRLYIFVHIDGVWYEH